MKPHALNPLTVVGRIAPDSHAGGWIDSAANPGRQPHAQGACMGATGADRAEKAGVWGRPASGAGSSQSAPTNDNRAKGGDVYECREGSENDCDELGDAIARGRRRQRNPGEAGAGSEYSAPTNFRTSALPPAEPEPVANPGSPTRRRGNDREGSPLPALPVLYPQEEARRLCMLATASLEE
jgi:hypothetical protein